MTTVRAKVILGVACGIGAAAGALTYVTSHSVPQALLAAGTATGGSLHLLSQVAADDPEHPPSGQTDKEDNSKNDIAGS
jgi:hypothetical protein